MEINCFEKYCGKIKNHESLRKSTQSIQEICLLPKQIATFNKYLVSTW